MSIAPRPSVALFDQPFHGVELVEGESLQFGHAERIIVVVQTGVIYEDEIRMRLARQP